MTAYSKFALGRTNSPATFVEDNAITTIVAIFNGGSECETVYLNGLWTHKYAASNIAGTTYTFCWVSTPRRRAAELRWSAFR
jgi:hypothetical protein